MQQVIITSGIPASGKSDFAKAWVAESPKTRGRVNRDDIRRSVFGASYGVDERTVTWIHRGTLKALLNAGKDVVIDDTNLNPKLYGHLRVWLDDYTTNSGRELEVTLKHFDVAVDEAIRRDAEREHAVGEDVIRLFHKKYIAA